MVNISSSTLEMELKEELTITTQLNHLKFFQIQKSQLRSQNLMEKNQNHQRKMMKKKKIDEKINNF